jgi:hypothetical protein
VKFCPAESAEFADSAGRYNNACTNRLIHLLPLQEALAPFPGLAAAGCSAAAGGSGAVAPSAAAGTGTGVGARESDPARDAGGRVVKLCGETVFEDLGLGMSSGTGNLEDTLVQ